MKITLIVGAALAAGEIPDRLREAAPSLSADAATIEDLGPRRLVRVICEPADMWPIRRALLPLPE